MAEKTELAKVEQGQGQLATLPEKLGGACDAIERVLASHDLTAIRGAGSLRQTLLMAQGINKLRSLLTPEIMQPIMALQGSALGFRTDKDKDGGYPEPAGKEAVIEGLMRGLRVVGNEFNIISNRAYTTKEGMVRLVAEFPGLTTLRYDLDPPKELQGGCTVMAHCYWVLDGNPMKLEANIPVRRNAGMGIDAVLGKATRKLLARVYDRLTGSRLTLPDGEVDDAPGAVEPPKELTVTNGQKASLFSGMQDANLDLQKRKAEELEKMRNAPRPPATLEAPHA